MDFEEASETTENNKHNCKPHFGNVILFDYWSYIGGMTIEEYGALFLVVTFER